MAEKQAKLLELLSSEEKIPHAEKLKEVVLKITSEHKSNSKRLQQQNQILDNAQTNLSEVKKINKNLSQEYNHKFDVVLQTQNKYNKSFSEQNQKVANLINEVNELESDVYKELDDQKKEYKELYRMQEEKLENLTNNLKHEQIKTIENVEEVMSSIDSGIETINEKQIEIQQFLNETQEVIKNQSEEIKVLQKSADVIKKGTSH